MPVKNARSMQIYAARSFFLLSVVFFVFGLATYFRFDGVVIQGLNADIGTIRKGQTFTHHLRIVNLTFQKVDATVMPTCGCALDGPMDIHLQPLSEKDVSVTYQISGRQVGFQSRTLIVMYNQAGEMRRADGEVHFTLL